MAPGRKAKPARVEFDEVERRLGYSFADRDLLARALTHPSAAPAPGGFLASYQRLEFLGDRVLGLVIAEELFRRSPNEDEGALSRRSSDLVRAETCAAVADALGLAEAVKLGPSESRSGVARRPGVLADLCEAVIGAIHLDGGIEPARAFVLRHWAARLERGGGRLRDPKSALQEWAQARGHPTPSYRLVTRSGPDHEPHFVMSVEIGAMAGAEGDGRSKREAEMAAARAVLAREGVVAGSDDEAGE